MHDPMPRGAVRTTRLGARTCVGLEVELQAVARSSGDRLGPTPALRDPDDPPRPLAGREGIEELYELLLRLLPQVAPCLPGPSGAFVGYGRVYVDCGHLELATAECADPFLLPGVLERLERTVGHALERIPPEFGSLELVANNHEGLLRRGARTWGTHENYLVDRHPPSFGHQFLPFLVSRVFAGAGALHWPSGRFLAGARPCFVGAALGWSTTHERPIHMIGREEHHTRLGSGLYRYHVITGDAHRSHVNLALVLASTVLAYKAICHDRRLHERARRWLAPRTAWGWIRAMRALNVLSSRGRPPRVSPRAIAVQRVYLDGARRWADSLPEPPAWVPRALALWARTLDAFEGDDREWLDSRLDAFIHHRIASKFLEASGRRWEDVPGDRDLACRLVLLAHDLQRVASPEALFPRLEAAGLVDHRVEPRLEPGGEEVPFVPRTRTRAEARARFIRHHSPSRRYRVDWACVVDHVEERLRDLRDPFAGEFGEWRPYPDGAKRPALARLAERERAREIARRAAEDSAAEGTELDIPF